MKKTILILTSCVSLLGFAAEVNWKTLSALQKSGDYAGVENSALTMVESAKASGDAGIKAIIVNYLPTARQKQGKYASDAAALADIDAIAATVELPTGNDAVQAAKLGVLYTRDSDAAALELSATWTGASTSYRRGCHFSRLKRYEEASKAFAASGFPFGYEKAAESAVRAKLPEKVYEYGYAAFSSGKVTNATTALKILNAVLDADYTGTAVTSVKVKELLQMVNRKYSRNLQVGATTAWDPVIQLVRTTLETY